jgi:hypothetical protein
MRRRAQTARNSADSSTTVRVRNSADLVMGQKVPKPRLMRKDICALWDCHPVRINETTQNNNDKLLNMIN